MGGGSGKAKTSIVHPRAPMLKKIHSGVSSGGALSDREIRTHHGAGVVKCCCLLPNITFRTLPGHMRCNEVDASFRKGQIPVDGGIIIEDRTHV